MSEFEQDPSANTGRFRAFVDRGDEETPRAQRSRVSPVVLVVVGVLVIAIVAVIIGLAG
jgi:hypothetical protein